MPSPEISGTICELKKYTKISMSPWAHGFGVPLEMTNSATIATQIAGGPPTAALIDGIQPVNYEGQERLFQYSRSDSNDLTTVDLLVGFKPGDLVMAGDFITDSAWKDYQDQQRVGIIVNFLAATGVGVIPFAFYKILHHFREKGGANLNTKIGGRRNFVKYATLLAGASALSGISAEKLSELRRILVANDVQDCRISPIVTLSDHENPESADLYDRTKFDLEKANDIPEEELVGRGLKSGKRRVILGTAHYFPSIMSKLDQDTQSISDRANALVRREAKFYATHGYSNDEAVQRLGRIITLMARTMLMRVGRIDNDSIALQPAPDGKGKIHYYHPNILPDYFSNNKNINQKAVVRLLDETKSSLNT